MNLYPTPDKVRGPLAPPDWTMAVLLNELGGNGSYFADLKRSGSIVCRLGIAGTLSEDEAHRLLAAKARLWIAEYLARPHSGSTEFGSLEE